ncbi:MAG TPA: RsmE family RNA methyltransferase [Segetibacter sp.]
MSAPIFYISEPVTHPLITLSEETSRHVVQVLRMKKGEEINLSDGKGTLCQTAIVNDHKKSCTVKVLDTKYEVRNTKEVSIGISLLKNTSRFEWFLEKATEIGVSEIIPLLCDRTEKQHFRFERMNNILISAMLQSQQYWLPKLHEPVAFNQAISSTSYKVKLIAHCEKEQKQNVKDYSNSSSTQIVIGPEGDFSPEEIEAALQLNYLPVTLGQTRLRTETAGVVAAALLCS